MEIPIFIAAAIGVGWWLLQRSHKRRTSPQPANDAWIEVRPSEPIEVRLTKMDGTESAASISLFQRSAFPDFKIVLKAQSKILASEAGDFFSAFKEIRLQLEAMGFIPQCYGANRNVMTTGMMTDMSGGTLVNLAAIGEPLDPRNVVGIFDSGPGLDPVTAAEQEAFREQYAYPFGRDDTIVKEFMRRLEGEDVMSLREIDPTERVKVVTIGGVVKLRAWAFARDYEHLIESGEYCITKVQEGDASWLVLWTLNGGPRLERLRPE